ncbi:MAG: fluoride efflux transporter CrcB [Sphingomicrobium sp.]
MNAILVFVGGGLGALLRHGVNRFALATWGGGFPIGTMIVNVAGSLIMGLLVGLFAAQPGIHQPSRLFLSTGLLGGFTTFSAFSLDALTLYERGQIGLAIGYVAASVILSLAAVGAGYFLARL